MGIILVNYNVVQQLKQAYLFSLKIYNYLSEH